MVQISQTRYQPTRVDARTHRAITDYVRKNHSKHKHLDWFLTYHHNRLPDWDTNERDKNTGQRIHTNDSNDDYKRAHSDWQELVSQATGRHVQENARPREHYWGWFLSAARKSRYDELNEWLHSCDPDFSINPLDYVPANPHDRQAHSMIKEAYYQAEEVWNYIESKVAQVNEDITAAAPGTANAPVPPPSGAPTPAQNQLWKRRQMQRQFGGGPAKTPVQTQPQMRPPTPSDHQSWGMTEGYHAKAEVERMWDEDGIDPVVGIRIYETAMNAAKANIEEAILDRLDEALNRSLSRVWHHLKSGNALAFMSAARGRPEGVHPADWDARNHDAHEALKDHVNRAGWSHTTIQGHGQEEDPDTGEVTPSQERTLVVPAHPDEADELEDFAKDMGNRFGQHSVIVHRPGAEGATLIHTSGSSTPGKEEGIGSWRPNRAPEFHSRLKGKRPFAFESTDLQKKELKAVRRSARPDQGGDKLLEPHEAGTTDDFAGGLAQ